MNNAAGLGFNGYDEKQGNRAEWTLLTNVKPFQLETATSLKVVIDVWNMRSFLRIVFLRDQDVSSFLETGLWLRRVCYDRLANGRTLGVVVLSAFWVRRHRRLLQPNRRSSFSDFSTDFIQVITFVFC